MQHFSRLIVRNRHLVLVIATLLLIPSVLGVIGTRINYDILSYLPPDLESMQAEKSLEDDFHLASTAMITVEGLDYTTTENLKEQIEQVPGVTQVLWGGEFLAGIPTEMLPEDLQSFLYGKNDAEMIIVRFDGTSASDETMEAILQIKHIMTAGVFMGGVSTIFEDVRDLINSEIFPYILCAVLACLVVLSLSLKSTVVPFVFMLGILYPILYNFGSNIIFGEISYITMALAAVLQLGVTMDFSIFLLHRYEEEKLTAATKEDAMVAAMGKTFTSITSSSLTTIAGFLALCTMRLLLGRDIGLVMAKGVALGVICTLVVLPCLLLSFDPWLNKWQHRTVIPKLDHLANFVTKYPLPLLIVFILIVVPFYRAQTMNEVYYTLFDGLPQTLTGIAGTDKLSEDFGMTTSHYVLVDEDLPSYQIKEMCDAMDQVNGVVQTIAVEKYLGPTIDVDFLPSEVAEVFHAGGYRLILVNSSLKNGTDATSAQLNELDEIVKSYDPNGMITGEAAMTNDLIDVASVDFVNVNYASILAVFVIIAINFRSLSIPILLVACIESAIFINMGIPYFTGTSLPFIASIVIGTIQLGATVDYAILMTTRFREERNNGHDARESARIAVSQCSQSILTSGLSFFAACIGVAVISSMELLKSLCGMISRGAIISMIVILVVLPALLILTEPLIGKTTFHWIEKRSVPEHE